MPELADLQQRPGHPRRDAQGREDVRAHHDLRPPAHVFKLQRRGRKGAQLNVTPIAFFFNLSF